MLAVSRLGCVRGDRLLFQDLSFELKSGELLYVHGGNGSGKSSLLRIISGLRLPDQGGITWNGGDIGAHALVYRQQLLYVGHLNALKDDLSVEENLRVAGGLAQQPADQAGVTRALQAVGLQQFARHPVRQLSQGQRRRVSLARLWTSAARLWLLDEPYAALDERSQVTLSGRVRQHLEQGGIAIMVTHQRVDTGAGAIQEIRLGA